MEATKPRWYSQKLMVVFLHAMAWMVVIALPFFLRPPMEELPWLKQNEEHFKIIYTVTNLVLMVTFYLNVFVLIPTLLNRKKVIGYMVSLVFLFGVLWFVSNAINNRQIKALSESPGKWPFPSPERDTMMFPGRVFPMLPRTHMPRIPLVISIFPFLFVVTASIAYSFITDRVKNEKLHRERETENLKSELFFLRSQVSPHFMFNVMNSVVSLARAKSDKVEPVLIQLSQLLRYMLYESEGEKVSLSKELEYIQSYIALQHIRFDDSVEINFNVSGNADQHFIEPMLLIPFVENAFKHGIGLIENPAIDIMLSINDNGILKFLVKNKYKPGSIEKKDSFSGIGLSNVRRRLNLLYAEKSKLTITTGEIWFTADLTIQLK